MLRFLEAFGRLVWLVATQLCGFGVIGVMLAFGFAANLILPHLPEIIEVVWSVVAGLWMWVTSFVIVQYIIAGLLIRWVVSDIVEDAVRAARRKD